MFDGQDVETEYDKLIISCLNPMFDAPKMYDKINYFPVISCLSFVIFIVV